MNREVVVELEDFADLVSLVDRESRLTVSVLGERKVDGVSVTWFLSKVLSLESTSVIEPVQPGHFAVRPSRFELKRIAREQWLQTVVSFDVGLIALFLPFSLHIILTQESLEVLVGSCVTLGKRFHCPLSRVRSGNHCQRRILQR